MLFKTIYQLLLLAFVNAEYLVKDFHQAPRGWTKVARAPADHILNLRIGLTQGNFAELHRQLYEVSDPRHKRYGQHLSEEEVNNLVRPSESTTDAVEKWLSQAGIGSQDLTYNSAHTWVSFKLSVAEAETLLDTEYSVWQHTGGSILVRTETFSLPEELHEHISTIQPTNSWARLQKQVPVREILNLGKRSKDVIVDAEAPSSSASWGPWSSSAQSTASASSAAASSPPSSSSAAPAGPSSSSLAVSPAAVAAACNFSAVLPNCIRTLYGTIDYEPKSNGASQLGVCNYYGEYNNRSDTYQFLSMYRPEAAQYALEFTQISVAGGPIDNGTNTALADTGVEGDLDSQYIIGVGYPLPLTTWATGGLDPSYVPDIDTPTNTDEPFLVWTEYILGQKSIPQVISTSYGDDEQTVSLAYATAVCNDFAQLGARGVSMLFSSGDYGIGTNDTCYSNADNTTYEFLPAFPATCPYVTAVGGTANFPEVAMNARSRISGNQFASGGGFSNYFPAPAYQNATVTSYIASLGGLYDVFYNQSGRGYPDIACLGQYFPIIYNGTTARVIGTSGSSPICSAVLGMVNDALITAGKSPLGFLNPWLYSNGYTAFTDVTSGTALGCNVQGFPATTGWDAVTGFGTPYFPKILQVLGL